MAEPVPEGSAAGPRRRLRIQPSRAAGRARCRLALVLQSKRHCHENILLTLCNMQGSAAQAGATA